MVGEPSLMGGDFGEEDERMISRLENTQYDPAVTAGPFPSTGHHPGMPPPPHPHFQPGTGLGPPPPHQQGPFKMDPDSSGGGYDAAGYWIGQQMGPRGPMPPGQQFGGPPGGPMTPTMGMQQALSGPPGLPGSGGDRMTPGSRPGSTGGNGMIPQAASRTNSRPASGPSNGASPAAGL